MTYLFVVIGLSVINSLATQEISLLEVLLLNGTALLITAGLEFFWWKNNEQMRTVIYEKIDLITPEKYDEMKLDLELRTGLEIIRFEIGDRKSTRLNSSHVRISYAVFCLKKKRNTNVLNLL